MIKDRYISVTIIILSIVTGCAQANKSMKTISMDIRRKLPIKSVLYEKNENHALRVGILSEESFPATNTTLIINTLMAEKSYVIDRSRSKTNWEHFIDATTEEHFEVFQNIIYFEREADNIEIIFVMRYADPISTKDVQLRSEPGNNILYIDYTICNRDVLLREEERLLKEMKENAGESLGKAMGKGSGR